LNAGFRNQQTMNQLLDNITWFSLTGHQAAYASGENKARRYATGFSPIVGFADARRPDFASLAAYCQPDEHLYCPEWEGEPPAGWSIHLEKSLFRMVWEGTMPEADEFPDAVRLGPQHAARALELAQLTNPGPFGPRTIELGEYFGWFEGGRLAAMAGERMHAGQLREVSGICTHPDFRGRGLARRLTLKLIRREMQRGETPFLHVMGDNPDARRLYRKMGFRDYCETRLRVISRD
jgi:ribosomal protein S18 acetylase RimI-like enzyme